MHLSPTVTETQKKKGLQCFSTGGCKGERLFSSTCMEKMHAILIAQRIPSRHRDATSVSSQSWRPTLKAARNGVQANWGTPSKHYLCVKPEETCAHLRLPRYLEHRPDVLQVCSAGERRLDVADRLHQGFGRLGHLLHLDVVQQTPLLLTGNTWARNSQESILKEELLTFTFWQKRSEEDIKILRWWSSPAVRLTLLIGLHGKLFCLLHGNLLPCYLIINGWEVFLGQVFAVVDAAVHLDVLLFCHLVLHLCKQKAQRSTFASATPLIYAALVSELVP